ncbi:hypothetical protein DYB28_002377 [Aphanomyces astaci]|uniref:RRM domain-containing protein n=1 Tax=Aphanomyces astaci TaxID=112090 RepID=A0A9X8DVX0_APHAT|nr:hypothetical protein DYB28_002377 [Aphanomyces astaci]
MLEHQRISPIMADEHDVASTSAAKKASKKQKKQQKQEAADVEAAAPVTEQSVAADETAVKSKKASKKSKQQKQEAIDVEAAASAAPVAEQTVATVEPTKASKKSKKQKKEAGDVEVPVEVVELVPELASFFSTSSQVFGKRIEPEIKLPVVVAPGADDSTSEQLAAATSTPAPPQSRDAVAKKVKKPKHKKVKALAEAAAAAAASGGDGADLATKPSTETPVVAASAPTIQEEEEEENAVDVKDPRTIFVGNVSLEATAADVKKFFASCGKVESVRLRSVPVAGCKVDQNGKQNLVKKVCVNKKLFVQGRDSCNAYEFFNKVLRVDRKAVSMDAKRSVFVGNLAFNATDDDVRSHFDKVLREDADTAAVESVRIIRDKVTHLGKGFGYVLFKDLSTAAKALSLHGSKMGKRELRVTVCGKRFKNTQGDKKPELKFEGRRAHPGAQLRLLKKRKAEEPADGAPPSKLPDQKKKPGFIVRGEKKPFDKTNKTPFDKTSKKPFDKTNKKPFDKKKGGGAKGFNSFKKGGYQDKSKASKAPRAKIQKPKHAARKARQALEKA